jgi:hypothetical protein
MAPVPEKQAEEKPVEPLMAPVPEKQAEPEVIIIADDEEVPAK